MPTTMPAPSDRLKMLDKDAQQVCDLDPVSLMADWQKIRGRVTER